VTSEPCRHFQDKGREKIRFLTGAETDDTVFRHIRKVSKETIG